MKLTRFERLTLANQFKILEALYTDHAEHYATVRKALEHGYEMFYSDAFTMVYEDEVSMDECNFVIDVLDMFSHLLRSWQVLKDKAGIDEHQVTFPGFDGNNEGKYLGFTKYFIDDLDRFSDLKRDNYNSHWQVIPVYTPMVEKWKSIRKGADFLTADQIREISEAGHYKNR